MTVTLVHPALLWLLPFPLLVRWLLPPRRACAGLVVPFLTRLETPGARQRRFALLLASRVRTLGLAFAWACVVFAMARPQIVDPAVTRPIPARDLLLAVDLSGSMAMKDFPRPDGPPAERLAAVKEVLGDFLSRREGDRVGLIFFDSAAFVQAPFTPDLALCRALLDEARVNLADPQTAFGDALDLASHVFRGSTAQSRVLIALTDGNDTASLVPPAKAAQNAAAQGIVIHTVALGDPRAAGEDPLDEEALATVARLTGGRFWHASNHGELERIYDELDRIEARRVETTSHHPRRDIYWWAVAPALFASVFQQGIHLICHRPKRSMAAPALGTAAVADTVTHAWHDVGT